MKIKRTDRTQHVELLVDESIFALQNGLVGVRGNFAEGYGKDDYKQTLVNGFYNTYDYRYEENSPAFPQQGQRIINVVDGQSIEFYLGDQPINPSTCLLVHLEREIDLETGISVRKATYKTVDDLTFVIREERLLSYTQKELFILKVSLRSLDYAGALRVVSKLQLPNKAVWDEGDSRINLASKTQLHIRQRVTDDHVAQLDTVTTRTSLGLVVGMTHQKPLAIDETAKGYSAHEDIDIKPGESYEIIKYVAYSLASLHLHPLKSNLETLTEATRRGFEDYKALQKEHLGQFWQSTKLHVLGDETMDQMVQYNLFQLYSCANDNPRFSIPAKGLTGEGYEGHYFWDTEIYMVPFFTLTHPEIAKSLLLYRYHHLDEAREEAKKQGVDRGAKIPWRTIDGHEASPYYPAGSAQYHINSDIAYTCIKYYEYSGDQTFMIDYGFEMLIETARFLYAVGNDHEGHFHINTVTGPDEYTTMVDDNYYTNTMAKYHFDFVSRFYRDHRALLADLSKRLGVSEQEIDALSDAADRMQVIYDEELGIFAQDRSFLQKPDLDFTKYPKDQFPLLLHLHPAFIYRHQILKQADVLLSMFLLDEEDEDLIERNFTYYLTRTTHDSSLSKCIHAIMAFRLGRLDLGYAFLDDILQMDLENTHKNTHHGLHIANSGGIYLVFIFGLLGLRIKPDGLVIRPRLPKEIHGVSLTLHYQGTMIDITLDDQIRLQVSKPLSIGIYTDIIHVSEAYQCDYK